MSAFSGFLPSFRRMSCLGLAALLLSGCGGSDDSRRAAEEPPPPPPPPALGTDAALASLSIDPATLSPAFDAATTAYTATVDDSVANVTVVAAPRDAKATMRLDGDVLAAGAPGRTVALATGINLVELEVTAENGTTRRAYTVEVTREAPPPPPPPPATVTLSLLVLDADGAPLPGVTASGDTQLAAVQTDAEGRAALPVLAIKGALLRLSGPGLVDQLRRIDVPSSVDSATPLRIGMVRRAAAQRFAAGAAVTLAGADGARVALPANAFVDAAGNAVGGQIEAFITPLDVATDAGLAAFPGGYEARGPGGAEGSLITLGVADFSFEQGGERLQLAPGVVATIDVPLYVTQNADGGALQVNDPIPLWSLAESDATWDYEGDGQVVASSGSPTGLALRGEATHFSWWNADLFVGRGISSSPGGIFESLLLPTLSCDEPGSSCAPVLPGQQGAWVQASILGRNGPLRSTSRWVPFAQDEEVEPIVIPTGFDIGLAASVSDGYYAVALIDPNPVHSEVGGELIEAEVLLRPRHLVDDGLFVPGERLRGYMTAVGEVHAYRFEGRAGRVFRPRGYPASSATAGPGITADLGATVRVFSGETLLAEAAFDATTVAEIDVTLPADGEFRVTFTADGKVPSFYVATTALLFPQARAAGAVAFPASPAGVVANALHVMGEDGKSYVRLSPAGTGKTCLGPTTTGTSCPRDDANRGRGDVNAPGWYPGFFQQLPSHDIIYLSNHDRPGFSDLFSVQPAEPELATRLSGAEVAGPEGFQVIDFRIVPNWIVYKLSPVSVTAAADSLGPLYVVKLSRPEQSRRALPMIDGRGTPRHEVSQDGRWVVYLSPSPASAVITGDLYAVDLDAPAAQPVRVNAPLDYAAGERIESFSISPDSRWFVYSALETIDGGGTRRRAYLVDLLAPGVATRISAETHTRTAEARFAPDGSKLVYRNSGTSSQLSGGDLYLVDLADPAQPGTPVQLRKENRFVIVSISADNWQIAPAGDRVILIARSYVFGLSFDNPTQDATPLLRVPSGLRVDNAGWPVFSGEGILLATTDESAANLPAGLIYQRFGDPLDGYRTLLTSADFDAGSRGVTQVRLSPSGREAIVWVGASTVGVDRRILSVPLSGDTPPAELVPGSDEGQGLVLRASDFPNERRYQFLPLWR
jgi:hypothetical protein